MRNDARPIGESSPASPMGGDQSPVGNPRSAGDREEPAIPSERPDSRPSVKHDRQSHIVHEEAESREPVNANGPGDAIE
jgi:hypothetical protein